MATEKFDDSWQDVDFEDLEKIIKTEVGELREGVYRQSVTPNPDGVSVQVTNYDKKGKVINSYKVLQTQSEADGVLVVLAVDGTSISYLKGTPSMSVRYRVNCVVGGAYDAAWTARYYIVKDITSGNTEETLVGTYSPIGSTEETVHSTPNLVKFLSSSNTSVTDQLIVEISSASLGRTARRIFNITSVYAEISLYKSYTNLNIARINRSDIQYVTNFAADNATLHVKTESIFGGNEKEYQVTNISSDLSAKTVSFSGEQEGERRVSAYIGINNDAAQSETIRTEMLVVGTSTRGSTMVAIDDVSGAVQYEDYTMRFGVFAANQSSAEAKVSIIDSKGNVTADATFVMTCSTTDNPDGGIPAEYTFSVPSPSFKIKVECNGYARTLECTAKDSSINWEIVEGAVLELNAKGRTNTQANADVWESNGVRVQFKDVEFSNEGGETANGWKDSQCLHLNGAAKAVIPFYPFYDTASYSASEYRGGGILAKGRTISCKFRVTNLIDISKPIISCYDEDAKLGFIIFGDSVYARIGRELMQRFDADQTSSTNNRRFAVGTENEVTITIESLYEGNVKKNPEVKMFINGEIAASTNITTMNTLSQTKEIPITVEAEGASVDTFYVCCYDKCLTAQDVHRNFVMRKNSQAEMIEAYKKNNFDIQTLQGGIEYCKAQSLKENGNCSIVVTTDIREGITSTSATDSTRLQQLHLYFFKGGKVDADRSIKYVARFGGALRIRVQGTSTAAMPKKNLRYDGRIEDGIYAVKWNESANDWYEINEENIAAGHVKLVKKLSIVINSTDDIPCTLLTTKTNYNESTATRNLPNALWCNDAINALAKAYPEDYANLLTPPQKEDARVRQTINGVPALQYYYNLDNETLSFTGKVDIITDKSNQGVFGFTSDEDYSVELRSNTSDVCNFKTSDLTRSGELLEDGITAGNDDLEYRYPDVKSQFGKDFIGRDTAIQRLWDFVYNCSPDHIGYESANGVVSAHSYLSITGRVPYITDDNTADGNRTYTVEPQTSKNVFYAEMSDWRVSDTYEYRKLKFFAEFHRYAVVPVFVFNGLVSHTNLWTDQRAKNQFFTHYKGDVDEESGNYILRLLIYDIDTSWRMDNDSRLRYDFTRLYSDPGIYDDDRSTLWVLMDACFQTEYKLMYQRLANLGFYSLAVMQRYYRKNQAEAYNETIYNADTEYKYLDTVTEGASSTDQRYKAHGSAVEDLDWWMQGRLYFVGGQYFTINDKASEYAQSSITLNLSPSTNYGDSTIRVTSYERNFVNILQGTRFLNRGYMEAYRDGGYADISLGSLFTTSSDYRIMIFGHKQVRSLGDISPLKITNIESTGIVRFVDMLIGSEEEGYENNVFSGFGKAVYAACEEVNTANCKVYEEGDLSNFPVIRKANFKGCDAMSSFRLPVSGTIEELHLPKNLQSLNISGKPKLQIIDIEGVGKINEMSIVSGDNEAVAAFALNVLAQIYNY